jgi:glutamate racemase
VFVRALAESEVDLSPVSAQPLSALVEAGLLEGTETEAAVAKVLAELPGVNTILLACTHYPALAPAFRKLRPGLTLLDPAEMAVADLDPSKLSATGRDRFFTTGDLEAMEKSAKLAFGITLKAQKLSPPSNPI